MGKETNYDGLSQVDSSLRKYFGRYVAPTLIKEQKILEQKKAEEISKLQQKYKSADEAFLYNGGIGITSKDLAVSEAKAKGKWNKKTTDDLIQKVQSVWNKDPKFKNDLAIMKQVFYFELCKAKNGCKPSQKLLDFANSYIEDRLNDLLLEQLARQRLPKDSISYIAQHAFDGSLVGVIVKGVQMGADEKVNKKVEELYKANIWEKGAGVAGSMALDVGVGGVGIGGSVIKFGAKKVGVSAGKAAVTGKVGAVGIDGAFHGTEYSKGESSLKKASSDVLGDKDAIEKIRSGSKKYQHRFGDIQQRLNSFLIRKVKLGTPSFSTSQLNGRNNILAQAKGDSTKLLVDVKKGMSKQAIPFNVNANVPAWMLKLSEKENRRMGAYYYSTALEMSRSRRESITIGGKKMTLKEVAQRAFDYSNAASFQGSAREMKYIEEKKRLFQSEARERQLIEEREVAIRRANETAAANQQEQQNQQNAIYGQVPSSVTPVSSSGWGNTLDFLGLDGLAGASKNLGYSLAMLPDMIMGMFTGKNEDMRIEDNLMPLAAIMGSFFVKHNPLLKLILLGYGGANLFSAASNAATKQHKEESGQGKSYKTYSDQDLNVRITNPAVNGNTLVMNIDGSPLAMKLSDKIIDAYKRGHIPLNTLANAALAKYEDNLSKAATQYEKGLSSEDETQQKVRQIK